MSAASSEATEWIYGRRTVAEHLRLAPESCRRLEVARGTQVPLEVRKSAEDLALPVREVDRERLEQIARGGNHQGVCLEVGGWSYWDLEDLAERARQPGRLGVVVALDSVQDPRNLGAVLRVVDGVGAAGVLIPKDRAVGLSASVARSAAGALASTPVARVVNLARALDQLRAEGFCVFGATADAGYDLYETGVTLPCVALFGGEHRGIRPGVARRCDSKAAIPMKGEGSSLNVAVACGVICYELLRRARAGRFDGF